LANKLNCTIGKIFFRFGKNLSVKWKSETKTKNIEGKSIRQEKQTSLITWTQAKEIIRNRKKNYREKTGKKQSCTSLNIMDRPVDCLPDVKINWRTKMKLSGHCSICGSTEDIEYHHVRHVRKGKIEGFLQVLNQRNRKQIPCCKVCHQKIHKGEYNGISLKDLYDEELVIL
jgi:hypothetical protein